MAKKQIEKEVQNYQNQKAVSELLSSSLQDIENKFKLSKTSTDDLLMSVDESYSRYLEAYRESINLVPPAIQPIGMTVITSAMLMNAMEHASKITDTDFDVELFKSFKEAVSDTQVVLAVGPNCNQVKVGDKIKIRFQDFYRIKNPNSVRSEEVSEIPLEVIDGKKYLEIGERNIKFIYKDEDFYERRK